MVAIVNGISTHILDTSLGRPAANVPVTLDQNVDGTWCQISTQTTDADGRAKQLLPPQSGLAAGTYRIVFDTGSYFEAQKLQGLYPKVEITFLVRDPAAHYHIPLLLTANGYSTYRGS
jgi:5-hydroxyisourate hydrolase